VPEVRRLALIAATAIACAGGCAPRRAQAPVEETSAREPEPRTVRVLHGKAVWYGGKWHGRRTASGERFSKYGLTAAHRSLPLGTRIRVINLENQRSIVLRVNDRGPYGRDRSRVLDVTEAAARRLGFHDQGWTRVRIEVLADGAALRARDRPASRRRR
jgi:rare lipoprotein A (peptidoglycan hydrolase)